MDKWLQNNTVIKLVALALAIMLWMSVNDTSLHFPQDRDDTRMINNVTLEALYDEDRFEVVQVPDSVNFVLRGDAFSLNMVTPGRYKAFVDLRELKAGRHPNVPVKVEGLPRGVDVDVRPSSVDVVMEKKQQKEMAVQVNVIGKPDDQFKMGEPVVKPARVLVRGPESVLDQVKAVKATVNAEGAKETISRSASLQIYGENGLLSGVEVNPELVDVTLPVASPNAIVPLKVDIGKYPPKGYAIENLTVNTDQVTVYGSKNDVEALEYYPGPKLDLSKAKNDRTFELPIPLTEGAVKVEPDKAEIKVDIVKSATKTMKDVPVKIKGKDDGSRASIMGETKLDFPLHGAPSLLKKIKKSGVEAYIDVSNLSNGEHRVPVRLNLPNYIRLEGEEPSVTVSIRR
ncbi:CdaR family protein [Salinithrix halophila]|uniref:YbbR-like domain-containing protein n=1 Tax=Salinithrix halophila TaxID=1485204 RepID=A0ABV8JA48_9BACL